MGRNADINIDRQLGVIIKIYAGTEELEECNKFCYLGNIIKNDCDCER